MNYLGNLTQGVDIPSTDYIHYYIEFACVDIAGGKSDCEIVFSCFYNKI